MELAADDPEAVNGHLRRIGWIDGDERVQALEPAGEGNMNITLRARLPARTLILKQARPYVVKYPQIAAPLQRSAAEAAFYRAIAGNRALRRHTPAVLGEDPDSHLLCLEDLGEGADFTFLYAGRGPGDELAGQLSALGRWLGVLHGVDTRDLDVPANEAMRALNHAHIFEIPFDVDNGVALSPALVEQRRALSADARALEQASRLGRVYLGETAAGAARALLHGDFYPGSWLALADGGVAVIDPEFAFIGPPEFDVGVLQAHLRMAGFEDAAVDRVLRDYIRPNGFDPALARRFAGVEVIRRLLGVAQLPLTADEATRCRWLDWAREDLVA